MKTLTLIELEKFLNVNSNLQFETLIGQDLCDSKINELQYSGCKIQNGSYVRVIFENCDFYGCQFAYMKFVDCLFINCKFHFTHLSDCNFEACGFEGTSLMCSTFKQCDAKSSALDDGLMAFFIVDAEAESTSIYETLLAA